MSEPLVRHSFQATLERIGDGVAEPHTPGVALKSILAGQGSSEAGIRMNMPVDLIRKLGHLLGYRVEVEITIRPMGSSVPSPE